MVQARAASPYCQSSDAARTKQEIPLQPCACCGGRRSDTKPHCNVALRSPTEFAHNEAGVKGDEGRSDLSRVHWNTSVNELALLIALNGYLVGHLFLQLSLLDILDEGGASPPPCSENLS